MLTPYERNEVSEDDATSKGIAADHRKDEMQLGRERLLIGEKV